AGGTDIRMAERQPAAPRCLTGRTGPGLSRPRPGPGQRHRRRNRDTFTSSRLLPGHLHIVPAAARLSRARPGAGGAVGDIRDARYRSRAPSPEKSRTLVTTGRLRAWGTGRLRAW